MTTIVEQLQEAADKATQASEQADAWVKGPVGTTVPTDSGPVPTIAEFTRAAQARADASIEAIGWVLAGDFTAGCTVTDRNQYVLVVGGPGYRWDGALPKAVSPGSSPTPIATGSWVLVGDATLRGDLSGTSGASLVKLSNGKTLQEDSQQSGLVRGNDSVNYAISGCAVRRDTSLSSNWELVSDSAHIPINASGVTGGVDVNIQYSGAKIGTVVAGPDERFASDGVVVGASVAANNANVSLGAPCSFFIDFDNSNAISFDGKFFDTSRFAVNVAASGLITVTHPSRRLMQMPVCQHTTGGSLFEPLTPHYVNTASPGTTSLYLVGEAEGLISYSGTSWQLGSSSWVTADMSFSFDAPTGVLTVTHPQVLGSPGLNVTPYDNGGDVTCHVSAVTGTGFKVKFRKLDGTIPTLSSALGFYFSRGISAIRKAPTGRLSIFLGHVQVNCNHVDYANGNFWYVAVMQT